MGQNAHERDKSARLATERVRETLNTCQVSAYYDAKGDIGPLASSPPKFGISPPYGETRPEKSKGGKKKSQVPSLLSRGNEGNVDIYSKVDKSFKKKHDVTRAREPPCDPSSSTGSSSSE